jgi:hypothetical protein
VSRSLEHPIGFWSFLLLLIVVGAGVLGIGQIARRYEPTMCSRAADDPRRASKEVLNGCGIPDPLKR